MAYGPVAYARNGLSAYGLCAMFLACACGPMATAKAYGPMAYGPVTAAQPKAKGREIAACVVSLHGVRGVAATWERCAATEANAHNDEA